MARAVGLSSRRLKMSYLVLTIGKSFLRRWVSRSWRLGWQDEAEVKEDMELPIFDQLWTLDISSVMN